MHHPYLFLYQIIRGISIVFATKLQIAGKSDICISGAYNIGKGAPMENEPHKGLERRHYLRIVYKPNDRPRLRIDSREFEVEDISDTGIRFVNDRNVALKKTFNGILTFLDGNTIRVEGKIEWEQDTGVGVSLKHPISPEIILKEQRHIILSQD